MLGYSAHSVSHILLSLDHYYNVMDRMFIFILRLRKLRSREVRWLAHGQSGGSRYHLRIPTENFTTLLFYEMQPYIRKCSKLQEIQSPQKSDPRLPFQIYLSQHPSTTLMHRPIVGCSLVAPDNFRLPFLYSLHSILTWIPQLWMTFFPNDAPQNILRLCLLNWIHVHTSRSRLNSAS